MCVRERPRRDVKQRAFKPGRRLRVPICGRRWSFSKVSRRRRRPFAPVSRATLDKPGLRRRTTHTHHAHARDGRASCLVRCLVAASVCGVCHHLDTRNRIQYSHWSTSIVRVFLYTAIVVVSIVVLPAYRERPSNALSIRTFYKPGSRFGSFRA